MNDKIVVDKDALTQVLNAVNQPLERGHLIRELQATRNLPKLSGMDDNPINTLLQDLENSVTPVLPQSKTITYTTSEMEAMGLYARLKGTMSTQDDPEEGIRFFTSLVDRIREERSVLAVRNR